MQFKRDCRIEPTQKYTFEAKAGFARQNMVVNFSPEKTIIRVSDFYMDKDGSLQDKEGKF